MRDVQFELSGEPVPASRPKVGRFGTFYPKRHMVRQETLLEQLTGVPEFPTDKPCGVRLLSVMPRYKTSDHPVHRSDVDNLAKLPVDCMTKVQKYWRDDDLIVSLLSLKRFTREDESPHTKIRVFDIPGTVEDFVDRQFEADL